MKTDFKTPVSMKIDNEEQFNYIVSELKKLGYTLEDNYGYEWNVKRGYNYVTNNYYGSPSIGLIGEQKEVHLQEYNPELFLALSAMTEGEDWIVGEWLVYIDKNKLFKCLHTCGSSSYKGHAGNNNKHLYRKATKEEIINHLSKKDMNKDSRFPFDLSPKSAKDIINIACKGWKPKLAQRWGKGIILGEYIEISEKEYKEMRKACTLNQHDVFNDIFGKDEAKFKKHQIVKIINGGNGCNIADGKVGYITNDITTNGTSNSALKVRVLDRVFGLGHGYKLEPLN